MRTVERVFTRTMPGGGFVAIEVVSKRRLFGGLHCYGTLLLERRAHPTHDEQPITIAEASGPTRSSILHQLMPQALSNTWLATAALARGRVL